MATIHFFDAPELSTADLRQQATALTGETVEYHEGSVVAAPDAKIISPFVSSRVSREIIQAMPQLKLIACRSTGYDNIDLTAATERGIVVCNVPSYGENTVAEYAFGLLLALVRKIPQAAEQLTHGDTSHTALQGMDLMGKTLGILGAGRIGCRMAAIGRGFGMTVIAYDAYPDPARAEQFGFTYQTQAQVLAQADVLSLHVPNLPNTKHLIEAKALAQMKPSAVLVNTARGEVIDTHALIEALSQKHLAGAALDVFEGEDVISLDAELDQLRATAVDQLVLQRNFELDTLRKLPNVLLTNHNAFNTAEAVARINQTTIANITGFLTGKPQNVVKSV